MKTNLTIENYEDTLKFLDKAYEVYQEKGKSKKSIKDKITYAEKCKNIQQARRALRALTFEMEDFIKTGSFEANEIKHGANKTQ